MTYTNISHIQETTSHKESVLKSLRSLMPNRPLTLTEAMERAELQANRLLAMHGIDSPGTPSELVTLLPHLRVEARYNLPVSGSAHWEAPSWVVRVNASDSTCRQRFSLMHEFKHVLDHPFQHEITSTERVSARLTHEVMRERVADYFAACVLMPKRFVKSVYCSGEQDIEALAARFQVSPKAMSYRLSQLGLTVDTPRCTCGLMTGFRSSRIYFRSLASPPLLLAAPGGAS